jgi:hypothetical protein
MPAKAWGCTNLIRLLERSSKPSFMGQEPDRISVAPSESSKKVQLPNLTVQVRAAPLDAARSPSSASKICFDHDLHIVRGVFVESMTLGRGVRVFSSLRHSGVS